MAREMSPTKQKILLLLLGGWAFSYSYTPSMQWRVIKTVSKEWKKINSEKLRKDINQLYQTKIINKKENSDGTITIVLTEKGKMRALTYKFQEMKIENRSWDGKWRIVVFDIPEKFRAARDALREKIKELGFYELQKSVFVFPYECRDEIEFIIEFFKVRRYVRFGILETIDNELHLKKIFNLV